MSWRDDVLDNGSPGGWHLMRECEDQRNICHIFSLTCLEMVKFLPLPMDHTTKTITEASMLEQFSLLTEQEQKEAYDFLEFLLQKKGNKKKNAHPKAGFLKGVFTMSKDFDEPLEDFKEYM